MEMPMSRSGTPNQPLPFPPQTTVILPPAPPMNLPTPLTAFIGRQAATDVIAALLTVEQARLLTLTGPGGVGKTRLALQVGHRLRPHFADGVFLVRLAALSNPDLVLPAIAQVLDV